MSPPPGRTEKARRTRERIRRAALALFAEGDYDGTTLREIARRAGTSVGLTYRYFRSKEDLVLSAYEEAADRFVEEVADIGPGPLGKRYRRAARAKLEILGPFRTAFGSAAVYSAALRPDSPVAVLGPATRRIRARTLDALADLVAGSKNTPLGGQKEQGALLLYAALLLTLLYWFNDGSPEQRDTRALVDWTADVLDSLPLRLLLRFGAGRLDRIHELLAPVLMSGVGGARSK